MDDCVITMVVLKLTVYPHNVQGKEKITVMLSMLMLNFMLLFLLFVVDCSGRGGDYRDVVNREASTLGDKEALAEV